MAKEAKGSEGGKDLFEDQSAQVPPTRATGAESATGQALVDNTASVPQGEDRGSTVPIAGGAYSDWEIANGDGEATVGAQGEQARFTSNGQLPHNMIPTPSGAVPVGATSLSVEDAEERIRDVNDAHDAYVNRGTERRKLSPQTVQRLSIPEIQAIAQQRGYDIPEFGGVRVMRQAFLDAQGGDDKVTKAEPKHSKANAGGAAGQPTGGGQSRSSGAGASAATGSGSNQGGQAKVAGGGSTPPAKA